MPLIRQIKSPYTIYESKNGAGLFAVHDDVDIKKAKSKIKAHPFELDEEHDSLKINFDKVVSVDPQDLVRFK